jgi:hypothetical protein
LWSFTRLRPRSQKRKGNAAGVLAKAHQHRRRFRAPMLLQAAPSRPPAPLSQPASPASPTSRACLPAAPAAAAAPQPAARPAPCNPAIQPWAAAGRHASGSAADPDRAAHAIRLPIHALSALGAIFLRPAAP